MNEKVALTKEIDKLKKDYAALLNYNKEYEKRIAELNSSLNEKDKRIAQLNRDNRN